jgi:hypothetical protein
MCKETTASEAAMAMVASLTLPPSRSARGVWSRDAILRKRLAQAEQAYRGSGIQTQAATIF